MEHIEDSLPLLRFKPRQLALIVAVGETHSVRQAAERLHLSQPAATRLLQELEETMGVALFERSRQGMTPTVAGTVLIDHARTLLTAMREAYVNTREAAEGKIGNLRLGVFGGADPERVATAVWQLKKRYPGIRITMEEAPLEMLLAALRDGKLDIVVSRIRASELSDSFRHEILYNERFVVVQSAISGMEQHLSLQPADLFQMAWILPPPDTLVRQHVDNFFAVQYGRVPPITIESASPIANLALLNSSNSIAVMAKQLADFFVNQGVIRTIPIDLGTFTRPVALITLRGQTRAPHIDHMIELLRSGAETIESGAMQGANADT